MPRGRICGSLLAVMLCAPPAWSQAMVEGIGVHAAAAGVGAGVAASANHGQVLKNTYEAALQAQQAAIAQSKAVQQYMTIGSKQEAQKDWLSAEKSFKYVLQIIAKRDGPGSEKSVPVLQHLVKVNKEQNKLDDAIGYQKTVVAFTKASPGHHDGAVLKAQNTLTTLFVDNRNYTAAEPVVRQSYALCTNNPSLPAEDRRVTCETYAVILHKLNREEDAKAIEQYLGDATKPFDVPSQSKTGDQTVALPQSTSVPSEAPPSSEIAKDTKPGSESSSSTLDSEQKLQPALPGVSQVTTAEQGSQPAAQTDTGPSGVPAKDSITEAVAPVPPTATGPDQVTPSAQALQTPPAQIDNSSADVIAKDSKKDTQSPQPIIEGEPKSAPAAPGANPDPASEAR